ncbi:ABC transporter ATP-binding protein [Vibrio campbellii]|uniref:ABC transporter ATP-binding protein n=1 Tax=Vibrio campbellii TaxID=680 RepID=A0ACC7R8I1_9VIBR
MTIEFSNFSFRYESLDKPTLKNINLRIEKGEKIVIIGPSGSGKSTLGQCLNGLIPHAIKGETSGKLTINGQDTAPFDMHQFTEQVGTVLQDTDSQFVGLSIGEDIAFALENQLMSNIDMYPLVKATAKMVDLEQMLDRSPHDLSGGQKQRVSLAGILVDDVDILLFDEPLAALDPKTGKKTIEIIDELHRETGKTIIIIEHRLEDVLHRSVDRIILMESGEIIADTTPDEILASPLLEEYGIREPLYLSALKEAGCAIEGDAKPSSLTTLPLAQYQTAVSTWFEASKATNVEKQAETLLAVRNLTYSYDGEKNALEDVSFDVKRGEFVSVLGKNGSGKSTITKLVMGVIEPDQGSMILNGQDLNELTIFERSQKVGVVMQNPNHMISHHMIFDEVAFGLRNRGVEGNQIEAKVLEVLELCGLSKYRHWPIEALSYGQKKRVTIASILALEPELLILDEPTAGHQDYRNYTSMLSFIEKLNRELGITVMIISHDMHLVLEYTTRSIVIADSKLIADAPMTEVFSSPALLDQANLATTSLYELATELGIENTNDFMQHFIDVEKARRERDNKADVQPSEAQDSQNNDVKNIEKVVA